MAQGGEIEIKWVGEASTATKGRAQFRKAKALFQEGQVEEALRMYTSVRDSLERSDSYWAICHNQMGLCFSKLGNDAEAIRSYTKAIETGTHKDMHIWYMNRAVKLKVSEDFEGAKADFDRVIELRPDSPQAQKARDHLERMQDASYALTYSIVPVVPVSAGARNHVIDLWNRLATAFSVLRDESPASRPETPPDSLCCSLLMLGDREILQWFLMGTATHLGPNPWKKHGCLEDVDVFARLSAHSIPIISRWLGDMCDGKSALGPRATAVRKWLSNGSIVKSAAVSVGQVEARLRGATLEHCAAMSGDLAIVQWSSKSFAPARERRIEELGVKVQADPQDTASVALLSSAVCPAPVASRGDTPDRFVPDRSISAVDDATQDTSKDARNYLADLASSVERYRLESSCTNGMPLTVYMVFWTIEAFLLYRFILRDPYESFDGLHNISWYSCAVLLFTFSWLIPSLRDVGPIPGWLVQGIPAVLWGGGLATFCVIQLLTAFQRLARVLPEYSDWIQTCTAVLMFLGYMVPHTQPLSPWSSALAYGHSISWSLLLMYLMNQVVWGSEEPDLATDGFFLIVQVTFYCCSAFHPSQFPADDDLDYTVKTLLVWAYTMLWRLLVFLLAAGLGEWALGLWVPTITYSLGMLQTGCLTLLLTYTTVWYSFDADKNVAKQGYVKARASLFMLGLVGPLQRELKDDLRDWRARTIKDRLTSQLKETLATVQNSFGAPKALAKSDCANPRNQQSNQFNKDYLRAAKLVDDEADLVTLGEQLDPELAQHMLTLTDKLQDYIFGCLNACLTRHDKLMRSVDTKHWRAEEQTDPAFFDEVVKMLKFLVKEGARWETRFAEGDCDGPTAADRRELAIGRAWIANVPAQRARIVAAWDRKRQEALDAEKRRKEEDRLRKLEDARRAAQDEIEQEELAAKKQLQRKEEAKKAAERRKAEEIRQAEQQKAEEAARRKREEARKQRQMEAAAQKDAQRREQMLAAKRKQIATAEKNAGQHLARSDPTAAAKALSKAIRVATELQDEEETARLRAAKESALAAAAEQAEAAKAKAAEMAARKAAEEEARKAAAEEERQRLAKLEQKRQQEREAAALAERRAKHDAALGRIEKAVKRTHELLERGEGAQAVRAADKAITLLEMLEPEFESTFSEEELSKLKTKALAVEKESAKLAAKAAAKRREEQERRRKEAEEKKRKDAEEAAEKAAAEARAAEEAKAAEEAAAAEKAAAEAAAFEAQMAELLKDDDKPSDTTPETATSDGASAAPATATEGAPDGDSAPASSDGFNIEMALGRDLLGDLGMDDDDGAAAAELASLSADRELTRTLEDSDHRLNDCLCPITHEIMLDPVIDALGHSYERNAIESWLANHQTSPITNEVLPHRTLVTNHALRKLILSLSDEERSAIRRRASSAAGSGGGGGSSPPAPAVGASGPYPRRGGASGRGGGRGAGGRGAGAVQSGQQAGGQSEGGVPLGQQAFPQLPSRPLQQKPQKVLKEQPADGGADPALARLLTSLQLHRFLPQFAKEEMDMEAFGMLTDEDLQEMDIAKGPRLKLLQAVQAVNAAREARPVR